MNRTRLAVFARRRLPVEPHVSCPNVHVGEGTDRSATRLAGARIAVEPARMGANSGLIGAHRNTRARE